MNLLGTPPRSFAYQGLAGMMPTWTRVTVYGLCKFSCIPVSALREIVWRGTFNTFKVPED